MKAKRLLASALALSMALGAMSALAVTANAAETTATITAIKADGTKVEASYTNDGILDAINAAGNGGTVEIGEGVVAISPNAGYGIGTSVTIKGQGIDKTTIKPADPEAYDAKKYEARHMLEILASDFKLENLTLDSSEVPGAKFLFNYPISTIKFVPLRLSGSTDSNNPSNIVLNNIEILRDTGEKCKGCIQIGTNSNPYRYANVTATDLYVDSNAGESSFADIDICDDSNLTLNGGGFSGIVLGTFNAPEQPKGYYSKTATIGGRQASAYLSIPYLLHCYDVAIENNDANSLKEIINTYLSYMGGAKELISKMTTDLITMESPLLYDYTNCDDQRTLAQRFDDMLGYIATDLEINDFAGSKTQLDTALEKADWHTWENEQDTDCNVCGYKREVAPEPEVTTSTATVGEGTEDYDNTFATGFVTTIPSGTEVTSVKWQVTSSGTTKETETFTVDANLDLSGDLKLGLIINGLNDPTATATAIINPAEVAK